MWRCCLIVVLGVCSAQLDVRKPPIITSPLSPVEKSIFGKIPNRVTVQCQATGKPSPTYEWYRGNVRLPGNYANVNVDERNGSLSVLPPAQLGLVPEDVAKAMEGTYTCHARIIFPGGSYAVAVSDAVTIKVARVSEWTIFPSAKITVRQGDYLCLPCTNIPQVVGEMRLVWSTQESDLAIIGHRIRSDSRRFVDQIGNLHLIYTQPEDNLRYLCGILTAYEDKISHKKTQLIITEGSVNNVKPTLQGSSRLNQKLTYSIGATGYLQCVFSGFDNTSATKTPTIKWYDGAGQVIVSTTKYTFNYGGQQMEIKNLQESDEQQYKCEATNSLGTAYDTMTLNVTSKPLWHPNAVHDAEVLEGKDASFVCQTRSAVKEIPPDTPRWFKNGVDMSSGYDGNKYNFSEDKSMLSVMNPQKDTDIVCFQCYVSNSVGTIFSSGCLNVIKPIVIVTKPLEVQSTLTAMKLNGLIDLTVVATADPLAPAFHEWTYNNITYSHNRVPLFVTYNTTSKLAYINVTALTKAQRKIIAGLYVCRVYNRFMEKIINITVMYEDSPDIVCDDPRGCFPRVSSEPQVDFNSTTPGAANISAKIKDVTPTFVIITIAFTVPGVLCLLLLLYVCLQARQKIAQKKKMHEKYENLSKIALRNRPSFLRNKSRSEHGNYDSEHLPRFHSKMSREQASEQETSNVDYDLSSVPESQMSSEYSANPDSNVDDVITT